MEKRKHQRIATQGLSVEISDGIGFFLGIVSDISMSGLRMVGLPPQLGENTSWLIVTITGHGVSFRMLLIKPKWSVLDGMSKSIGGLIVDPSWDWADFVNGVKQKEAINSQD